MTHGPLIILGQYWACDEPEREPSKLTCYGFGCRGCLISFRASVEGGYLETFVHKHNGRLDQVDAREWLAEHWDEYFERAR